MESRKYGGNVTRENMENRRNKEIREKYMLQDLDPSMLM